VSIASNCRRRITHPCNCLLRRLRRTRQIASSLRRGIEYPSEVRQYRRIESVSLGQLAHAAGKLARLARVDHRQWKVG
jgi:hypothetical protein